MIAFIKAAGSPIEKISLKIKWDIEKPLKVNFTSLFFTKFNKSPIKAPKICPVTVAMAAPFTSSLGNPKSPKIKMGSKIKFITAPIT